MSRMAWPKPAPPSVMARQAPPVEMVKMVMSGVFFTFLQDLVEGELGEGIAAGGDEDDVFAALDAGEAVFGFVERVEEVALGEAGDHASELMAL